MTLALRDPKARVAVPLKALEVCGGGSSHRKSGAGVSFQLRWTPPA